MKCSSCDIASLHCLIQNLEERNKELEEIITKQAKTITHLQSRITELEATFRTYTNKILVSTKRIILNEIFKLSQIFQTFSNCFHIFIT